MIKKDSQEESSKNEVEVSPPNTHETRNEKAIIELQEQKESGLTEDELNKLAAQRLKDIVKNLLQERADKRVEKYVDKVQLGEEGWKLRYYTNKFHVS